MTWKDLISLCLAGAAFVISLISMRQKKFETERAIRRELSDAIDKLNKISIENAKLWEDGLTPAEQNLVNIYSQQVVSLTRQAIYLAEQIPKRVSDVEYGTLAIGLINVGNVAQADLYFRKAVAQSPDPFSKAVNTRGYAYFLFSVGIPDRGRQAFQESLAAFNTPGNLNWYAKGSTYLRWGIAEEIFTAPGAGAEKLREANEAFKNISIPMQKKNALNEYENMLQELSKQMAQNKPLRGPASAISSLS